MRTEGDTWRKWKVALRTLVALSEFPFPFCKVEGSAGEPKK